MDDFSKIIRTENLNQVLFYIEPDGDDYLMHQIITIDGNMINLKLTFIDDNDSFTSYDKAINALNNANIDTAHKIENAIFDLMKEQ